MSPRLDDRTRGRIIQLAFSIPGPKTLSAMKILDQLQEDNDEGKGYIIPESDRTIHAVIRKARERETAIMEVDRQPWSLATMDKAGIPWEAAQFLIDVYWFFSDFFKEDKQDFPTWFRTGRFVQKAGISGESIPQKDMAELEIDEEDISEEDEEYVAERRAGLIITNRQAKWLWRMHLMVPDWTLPDWLPELCALADRYAQREMSADYLGWNFYTRDLDVLVMMLKHGCLDQDEISDICCAVQTVFCPPDAILAILAARIGYDNLPMMVKQHLRYQETVIKHQEILDKRKTEKEKT